MPYALPADVRGVLAPDPAFPAGTAGELSDESLARCIATAAAQVDVALTARYEVPFPDPAPRLVADISVAIASWLASLTYRKSVDITANDPIQLRYQWATGLLAQLAKGELDLPGTTPEGPTPTPRRAAKVIQPYRGEMFPLDSFGLTDQPSGRIRPTVDPAPPWSYT